MESGIIKRFAIVATIVAAMLSVSYFIGRRDGVNKAGRGFAERVDTLIVRDTITQYKAVIEERVRLEKYPVFVEKTDTLWKHDTLYVYLQREQVVWKDDYSKVYASGIMPKVDSVEHYVTREIVTKEISVPKIKKTRWGIGVQVGYGIQFGDQIHAAPYVGVGVSYDLLTW